MRLITGVIVAVVVSGCSVLGVYDSGEYKILNDITTAAELSKEFCGKPSNIAPLANMMYANSVALKNYTQNQPHNEYMVDPTVKLVGLTKEFKDAAAGTSMSSRYCEIKLDIIHSTSSSIQKISGNKGK